MNLSGMIGFGGVQEQLSKILTIPSRIGSNLMGVLSFGLVDYISGMVLVQIPSVMGTSSPVLYGIRGLRDVTKMVTWEAVRQ